MKKLSLTCGSCLFLERDRTFDRRCEELGKLPSSKACMAHKPDAFALAGNEENISRLKLVSRAIRGMTLSEVQALAAVLHAERVTRKHGWQFYQRVYVRFIGNSSANYFSNFAVGYVVAADKDHVRIVGDSGKMMVTALNDKNGQTVYTADRFKEIAAEMTRKRQFIDPASTMKRVTQATVQSLDDVLDSDAPLSKKLVKSKTKTDDLVSIISKMSMGFGIKPKRTAKRKSSSGSELVMDWNK